MPTMLTNGNLTNASHKWEARSNHWTLLFDNICPLKDSMKLLVHLKFKGPCLITCQWTTNFGCPSQYRVSYTHIQILKIMITSWYKLTQSFGVLFLSSNQTNWSTNICGISKRKTCMRSFTNIQDQIAI
jgi:hypothetical protein